ncbi:hypothetical protein NQZ68_010241 [Dissostichus eleginoides]|nr:hypothetical protein NQZ68_010241 [Dissostichus eleginoides]
MASSGPPAEENLLTRVTRWFTGFAGGSLWPMTHARPDAATPLDDPVLPEVDEEELGAVGVAAVDGLQEAQAEPHGGNGDSEQPPPAAPSPVYYTLPYAVPYAAPYAVPYAAPYAVPYAAPYAVPYYVPYSVPYVVPYSVPYAVPSPYYAPCSNPYAYPYAAPSPYADRYAYPYAAPSPFAEPYAYPQAAAAPAYPHTALYADPPHNAHPLDDVDNDGLDEYLHRYLDEQSSEDEDEDEEEEIDVVGLDIPVLDVEEIGPLFPEDSSEEPEDALVPGSPSSSRSGCSTRRCREDSEEGESAAKRPRWSGDSDED